MDNFYLRLNAVKAELDKNWQSIAAFAIFHQSASLDYLVFIWWGNGNELFTHVSVYQNGSWLSDPLKFSFCLYDMEVMWRERNIYIETMDCLMPSLPKYRVTR